jgi:hypothetical protein
LWTVSSSIIALLFSFFNSGFFLLTYFLWVAAAILAGIVIVDFKSVIILSIASYFFSSALMFILLSLPVFLGTLSYQILNDLVFSQNLKLVFSFTFPPLLLINIVFGVVGGYIGEILLASHP